MVIKRFARGRIGPDQVKDTGMAMVFVALLLSYFEIWDLTLIAIVLLLVNMTWFRLFTPVATVWFGFAHIMGAVMSRLVLGLIFFLVVLPVGLIRRGLKKNPLLLNQYKKGGKSVFVHRNITFSAKDIEALF